MHPFDIICLLPSNHPTLNFRDLLHEGWTAFYWYQIFTLDFAIVEVQEMFGLHGSLLTYAMYHHGETL